jgi:type I restriction enzyme S subunit
MEVKETPFTELLSKIVDNRGRSCPTAETGIPLIATNCIRNGLLYPAFEKVRYVSTSTYDTWFRGHPAPGDLIFVCKGTPGRVCMTPDPVSFCIAQDMVAVRADPKKIYPKYLFALLRSSQVQEQIGNMHVGTLIPHFKKGDFDKSLLPIPDKKTQEAIGDAYFELSAKIELNRRMNATLEAIARALFQSWFVDFDPVRAKLDGRQAVGLDHATAVHFPEHLEETALGHTPKGWEIRSLDKIADYLNGLALQKYPPGDGPTLPVIKIAQLRKGDSVGADRCNTDVPPNYVVQDGDVLFSWSGSLEVELWCGGAGALNQHLFKVTSPEFPKWFYYLWTLYHLDGFRLIAADKATTMGHIQRGHLTAAKVLIPPRTLLDAMTRNISPLIDHIVSNRIQSRTLVALRDMLLPRLLSGELSVAEVEKEVSI